MRDCSAFDHVSQNRQANAEFTDIFRAAFVEMVTFVADSRVECGDATREAIISHLNTLQANDTTKMFGLLTAAYLGMGGHEDDVMVGGRYATNDPAESLRRLADWIDANRAVSA